MVEKMIQRDGEEKTHNKIIRDRDMRIAILDLLSEVEKLQEIPT